MAGYIGTKAVLLSTTAANVGGDMAVGGDATITGTVTATSYAGDGSALTNTLNSFPAGTVMLFQQTSAPTGWTKLTTHNNKALRVVSGTAGSGGTMAFTSAFANRTSTGTAAGGTVSNTTLTVAQMPSHRHNTPYISSSVYTNGALSTIRDINREVTTSVSEGDERNVYSYYEGGGGSHGHGFTGTSHTHGLNIAVQYVDVIFASKD